MGAFEWPRATSDAPRFRAVFKAHLDDFEVDEMPAYEPCGEGDHTYLRIEKRGLSTARAVREIARALGVRPRDVGVAGLKDAGGVTRQTLSLEHADPERVAALSLPRVRVVEVSRHRNKIRTGHLRGNRFRLKLREVGSEHFEAAAEALERLASGGAPNYFGPQRFGLRGDTWVVGRALLKGDFAQAVAIIAGLPGSEDSGRVLEAREAFDDGRYGDAAAAWPRGFAEPAAVCRAMARGASERDAVMGLDRRSLGLYVSAFQSYLFNEVLASRIRSFGRILDGDIAFKHENGAVFLVEDAAAEQGRADRFEISPTGPLFGRRARTPTGEPGEIEAKLLEREGLDPSDFPKSGPLRCPGGRRPLRFRPGDSSIGRGEDEHGPCMELSFTLPPGAYATVLLREICGDPVEAKEKTAPDGT